jgi:hypothetical protein
MLSMQQQRQTRLARPRPGRAAPPVPPALALWQLFEAEAWDDARRLLDPRFVARWPQSGECFRGADDFIAVNRAHPAPGWRLVVHAHVETARASALQLSLEHAEGVDDGACFYVLRRGRIVAATELWAERTPAPAWRATWNQGAAA